PVFRGDETRAQITGFIEGLAAELRAERFHGRNLEVEIDMRDIRGGDKQWEWVKRGVPLRIEVGPRDVEAGSVMVARRDKAPKDKASVARVDLPAHVLAALDQIQTGLFERARAFRRAHTRPIDTRAELDAFFTPANQEK